MPNVKWFKNVSVFFSCDCIISVACEFVNVFFLFLFWLSKLYLSASELVGSCVCGTSVVVSNSNSLYCVVSEPVVVLMDVVVGGVAVVFGSVNWFFGLYASGTVINAGRIGARIVDDNILYGRSVIRSKSYSFCSICSSLHDSWMDFELVKMFLNWFRSDRKIRFSIYKFTKNKKNLFKFLGRKTQFEKCPCERECLCHLITFNFLIIFYTHLPKKKTRLIFIIFYTAISKLRCVLMNHNLRIKKKESISNEQKRTINMINRD